MAPCENFSVDQSEVKGDFFLCLPRLTFTARRNAPHCLQSVCVANPTPLREIISRTVRNQIEKLCLASARTATTGRYDVILTTSAIIHNIVIIVIN